MLHRHSAHGEAVSRIGWCIAERRIGVISGEVGAGKTVAVRAALSGMDRSRHTVVYLPDPTVGVRGIHHRIVAPLGGQPLTHHATLARQAVDALAAEHAERGRVPVVVLEGAPARSRSAGGDTAPTTEMDPRPRSRACSSASPPCGGG